MSQTRTQWLVTALVAVTAVLGTLLYVKAFQDPLRQVYAQTSEGAANYVIGVVGEEHEGRMPLFVIETRKRAIMVYDYDHRNRRLYLRAARTYTHDSELQDENFNQRRYIWPDQRRSSQWLVDMFKDYRHGCFGHERKPTGDHLVKDNAQ